MKYEIRYKPAFSTVFITLNPGEGILAEAGAMASMDGGIVSETRLSGGLFPAIARKIFGGESLFVNIFRNR
ncbi:MAG: AIM24 family protein, partial [Cyanobacteria bacterium J06641_5]